MISIVTLANLFCSPISSIIYRDYLDIDDAKAKTNMILQLHKILRPFMLRRLKANVEKTLPPKHETTLE